MKVTINNNSKHPSVVDVKSGTVAEILEGHHKGTKVIVTSSVDCGGVECLTIATWRVINLPRNTGVKTLESEIILGGE